MIVLRRLTVVVVAVAAMVLGTVGSGSALPTRASGTSTSTPISLLASGSTAFAALGHSCGGIQQQAFATGFDATSGYPTGDVYLQTRCGGSGRGGGGHTTTYSAWVAVTWDFTGAEVTSGVLTAAPTNVDPAFSAFDTNGNEVANSLGAVNVQPPACTPGNTTYCTYRAWLILGPGIVAPPRVTAISVTAGPSAGGTSVTITGTGLTAATAVSFGATPAASFTVAGDTSITALSPVAGAGTVDVTVTTAGGPSATSGADLFTFVAAPSVSGISPDSGSVNGGTTVTITGANFTGATTVAMGDTPVGFTVAGDTSITVVTPVAEGGPDNEDFTVTSIGGTSPTSAADQFAYTASTGCGGGCGGGSVQCAKLSGTATGTMTLSKCTPTSSGNTSAVAPALTGSFTWNGSGATTIGSVGTPSSPGAGGCRKGGIEYDITGTVTGGTSTYTGAGDTIAAQVCVSRSGRLSLVKGTTFTL